MDIDLANLPSDAQAPGPILDDRKTWLEATPRKISGKSDLAKAIRCTLSR